MSAGIDPRLGESIPDMVLSNLLMPLLLLRLLLLLLLLLLFIETLSHPPKII